ncbi:aldose 1-epimerase family protein [Mesorhizobium sp. KR9-304]
MKIFDQEMDERELARRAGALSQFAGVRLMTLGDGVERGIRMLAFRTAAGLMFTVLVDRAFDIGDCEFKGIPIGWHSPTGFRNPGLHEYEGEDGLSWVRSFSGLLVTCGLDHILYMNEVPADNYVYGPRNSVHHSLHGRVANIPARLVGYGETKVDDKIVLWAEGIVVQATVFGEDLHLIRRIEADVDGQDIRLIDRVVNHGFYRTPHMYCYHINLGFPILDEGSRYIAPIRDVVWAAHAGENYRSRGVGYHRQAAPQTAFHEQVWEHELAADETGHVSVALVNDRIGIGLELTTVKSQFPCHYEWQNLQEGLYALGFEPSTNHVTGNLEARKRNELIWLEHGEERRYETTFSVLNGAAEIAACAGRIGRVQQQPVDEYPEPSFNYPPIEGRV